MKAKTKFQKSIMTFREKLPEISEKQKAWAYQHCITHIGKVMKKGIVCLDCGYVWQEDTTKLKKCICPQCNRKLFLDYTRRRIFKDMAYFEIMTVFRGHQLLRYFLVKAKLQLHQQPEYDCKEIVQQWISPQGNRVTLAVMKYANFHYYDIWDWSKPLEIRKNDFRYDINPFKIYPIRKYLPETRRNGFKGKFHGIHPANFFSLILKNNIAETLLKCNEIKWFQYAFRDLKTITRCWPAIKIVLRHKQKIKDIALWLDYMDTLLFFQKDIRNPKYAFPADLSREHDLWEKKRQKIVRMQALKKSKEEKEKAEEEYKKRNSPYLGIHFSDGLIQVSVLQDLYEVEQEGNVMHHCIYTCGYYKKSDSLLLSARIQEKRVETIEVSLKDFSIVQSRGVCNQNTQYHDRIVSLVEKNMNLIKYPHQTYKA